MLSRTSAKLRIGIVRPASVANGVMPEAVSLMLAIAGLTRAVLTLKSGGECRNRAVAKLTIHVMSFALRIGAIEPRGTPPAIVVASL